MGVPRCHDLPRIEKRYHWFCTAAPEVNLPPGTAKTLIVSRKIISKHHDH
jgi:hypothetical protein